MSSLDTLNDIDTENINIHNLEEISSKYLSPEHSYELYQQNEYGHKMKGIEQEWSYSLNNSTHFSNNDQRLMSEIIRKLKPIIKKTIKKQIKHYMEKQMIKELHKNGFMLSKINTDSFINLEDF